MNNLKTNTSGIDCVIKDAQTVVYDSLKSLYPSLNIEGFGRLYKNTSSGLNATGYIPEYYFKDGRYQEMYLDNTWNITFSFLVSDNHPTQDGLVFVAPVKIVFWFNLDKIATNERRDDEAHRVVNEILHNNKGAYNVTGLETGIDNVYQGYNLSQILLDDMQPFHVFAFSLDLRYNLMRKC